jgi:hypothetical protein
VGARSALPALAVSSSCEHAAKPTAPTASASAVASGVGWRDLWLCLVTV